MSSFKQRLKRLEGLPSATNVGGAMPERDWVAELNAWSAYVKGEGPRPPDPPKPSWMSQAEYERQLQVSEMLRTEKPMPGMTDEEFAAVAPVFEAFRSTAQRARERMTGDGPWEGGWGCR